MRHVSSAGEQRLSHGIARAGGAGAVSAILAKCRSFIRAPHSADVRARSPIELLQITHADYADMIHEGVWAAYKLAYNVVQATGRTLAPNGRMGCGTGQQPAGGGQRAGIQPLPQQAIRWLDRLASWPVLFVRIHLWFNMASTARA